MSDHNQNVYDEGGTGVVTYEPLGGGSPSKQLGSGTGGVVLKRNDRLDDEIGVGVGIDVLPTVQERSKSLSVYDSGSSVDEDQDFAARVLDDEKQQDTKTTTKNNTTTTTDDKNKNNNSNSKKEGTDREKFEIDYESDDDTTNNKNDGRSSSISSSNNNDRRKDFANSTAPIESQTSFRMEWTVEQMNSNFAQRSWYRETRDTINNLRYRCGMIVNNKHVQTVIVVMISINAIMMGLATFDFVKDDPVVSHRFEIVDKAFLIIFTVELGMQFIYHGLRLLLDGWLVFDLIIITVSWAFAEVQIIRAFRIFRALRLVTRIKIMKNLILALFGVMPRMAAIGLMLALIFYIFGVMFTQLFKDIQGTSYNYFGSLGWTFFTLFQMMTLDDWASICREVIEVYKWAWLPFILFVIISGFIIVNLIIAVICDAIGALHTDEKAKLLGDYDEDGSNESETESIGVREQLDTLEDQMEDLTRIQARTYHTLQYLTRQIQMHKVKKELQSKTTGENFTDAIKKLKSVRRASQMNVMKNESTSTGSGSGSRDSSNRSNTLDAFTPTAISTSTTTTNISRHSQGGGGARRVGGAGGNSGGSNSNSNSQHGSNDNNTSSSRGTSSADRQSSGYSLSSTELVDA